MEFENNEQFDECVEKFKVLKLKDKRKICENDLKEIMAILQQLNEVNNNKTKVLFNREITDINKEECSEDDFVEAMFVYINSIKELLASYIDVKERK